MRAEAVGVIDRVDGHLGLHIPEQADNGGGVRHRVGRIGQDDRGVGELLEEAAQCVGDRALVREGGEPLDQLLGLGARHDLLALPVDRQPLEEVVPLDVVVVVVRGRVGRVQVHEAVAGGIDIEHVERERLVLLPVVEHDGIVFSGTLAEVLAHRQAQVTATVVVTAARGVFTITGRRYDDGRRDLRLTMREHFRERAAEYNAVVFDNGQQHEALALDVFDVDPTGYGLVYLDPPYTPPNDDNDYIKRYHFLEGLSVYWEGQEIMAGTKTKKLVKRFTPFAYKRTITDALGRLFEQFADSTIILSYSSNAVPDAATIVRLLRDVKAEVTIYPIDHTYSFGTHAAATRRAVSEYLFVGR